MEGATHEIDYIFRLKVATKDKIVTCQAAHRTSIDNAVFPLFIIAEEDDSQVFNHLDDTPSDNNGSERGIRKLKIILKNSCTFRSDFGADTFFELHSIVETAKKHDRTPYNAIQDLFKI